MSYLTFRTLNLKLTQKETLHFVPWLGSLLRQHIANGRVPIGDLGDLLQRLEKLPAPASILFVLRNAPQIKVALDCFGPKDREAIIYMNVQVGLRGVVQLKVGYLGR